MIDLSMSISKFTYNKSIRKTFFKYHSEANAKKDHRIKHKNLFAYLLNSTSKTFDLLNRK